MVWLSTNACNARCLHCSSASAKRTADELTTAEICRLLRELAEFGVLDLAVSGGEPLVRSDIFTVLECAVQSGLSVGVGSNGSTVTPERTRRLRDLGLSRIQFSLDGPKECHDRIRVWPGLYDKVLTAIELSSAIGLRVHVCCTICRLNVHALEELAAIVADRGVLRLNLSRFVPTGRGSQALDLTPSEWKEVIHRCAALRARYAGRMDVVGHLAQEVLVRPELVDTACFAGCQAGSGQGCISANGTVYPCVLLPVPVGNVRTTPFSQIWENSEVLQELRARTSLEGKCGTCRVRAHCGGCRAVAYAKTGDWRAADPRCWLPDTRVPTC
jgi:radical SAM protein with 4Fe4S-binding SPASM domain